MLGVKTTVMAAVVQIKERITILLTLAAFNLSFLCFRDLGSIPAVYVGATSMRANILVVAMYHAVYPELSSKLDKSINRGLLAALMCWLLSNVLISYGVYFDSRIVGVLGIIVQGGVMVSVIFYLFRWVRAIAVKQEASFIQLNRLTAEEHAVLSYLLPLVLYIIAYSIFSLASGEVSWAKRSEMGLIFHMAIVYFLHMVLILVPGRILHMFAVTQSNLLRLKQIFVRYVSHEIRSPLNVVHVGLEMLVALINSADPTSPFISIDRDTADFIIQMFFSSESAINILNDLLQYEHIEAGTFRLSCEALSLVNVLENKFGWANVMASQKGVAFRVNDTSLATEFGPIASVLVADVESGLDMVPDESLSMQRSLVLYIDIYRIEQVIRNLIINAMKFTPREGKISVGISCELFSSDAGSESKFGPDAVGCFRVEITDSGAGLSEDEHRKIFGEFTQFNKNELQGGGGSGLGLWISRHVIHMHKGFMGVTSAGHGHGSTFFFELPVFGPGYSPSQCISLIQQQQQQLPQPKPSRRRERSRHLLLPSSVACEEGESEGGRSRSYIAQQHESEGPSDITPSDPPAQSMAASHDMEVLTNSVKSRGEGAIPWLSLDAEKESASSEPLRLLIVDDSSLNVKVVVRLIESEKTGPFANATLLTADDGATAVEQLRTEMAAGRAVHFILMDFVMVGISIAILSAAFSLIVVYRILKTSMHGPEAARIMREELNYRGVIIGITGNALPEDIDFFLSSGANQVVTKPLSKAKLLDALHRYFSTAMTAAAAAAEDEYEEEEYEEEEGS